MRNFFVLCLLLLAVGVGGCATGSAGNVRYSHIFQPKFSVSIVNNTSVLLNVEINGDLVAQGLTPGQTYHWPVFSFRDGDVVTVVAKGHDQGGVFLGMAVRSFYLYSHGGRRAEVWEVRNLSQPGR